MKKLFLSISAAAEYLGVSAQTLRRWHASGAFRATFVSAGGHRWYTLADLDLRSKGIAQLAKEWARSEDPFLPHDDFYCKTSDVFKARSERMMHEMQKNPLLTGISPLVSSIVGEIGNNSFDHNIGNWPDVCGVFFAYDLGKRMLVLADRGRGILQTLQAVRPSLHTDAEALQVAWTEIITGRAPEQRGNGLKYVGKVVQKYHFPMTLQSGDSVIHIEHNHAVSRIMKSEQPVRGCLFLMTF